MSKSIKQIADELGVSKTAIRKRFTDDFKAAYVETNLDGSLQVSDEGCKLLMESLRKLPETSRKPPETSRKPPETPQTKFAETSENHGLWRVIDTQKEMITLLNGQLEVKDEQIRSLQEQIISLQTELERERQHAREQSDKFAVLADQAQQLNAADKKTLMLIEGKESERKLSFWERRAAKKAEKKARKEQVHNRRNEE